MSPNAERRVNLPLRGRCRRQKGCISTRRRRGCMVFAARGSAAPCIGQPTKGRPFYGQAKGQLRLTWRSYAGPPQHIYSSPEGRHHNPRPEGPSNLRTLRTFGAKPRQPSHNKKGGSTVKSAAPFLLYAQISFVCFTSSMVLVPASCMVMDSSLLKWSNTDFTPSAPPRLRP